MKEFSGAFEDEDFSEIYGETLKSEVMEKFSIQRKETDEYKEKSKSQYKTWTGKFRGWVKKEKARKKKFDVKKAKDIKILEAKLKTKKTKKLEAELEVVKGSYYQQVNPPFPASDVNIQQQIGYLAKDEYIPKPYDIKAITELIEGNNALKTAIGVKAKTSVGLGQLYRPTNSQNVADFSEEDLKEYYRQGKELLSWYNDKAEIGKKFYQIAEMVNHSRNGLGEGYFEIIENRKGIITSINLIPAINIWEGQARDRYIYIKNGQKKYFKKFTDRSVRDVNTFKLGASLKNRANRLLPLREFNLISTVYGVPVWTGAIPEVIGHRYSNERNVYWQLNDAQPRMVVAISGGAVDDTTTAQFKKFFSKKGKGRQHAGRVLVMSVSSKNQLSPNAKPPVVTFEKLTDSIQDASYMEYARECDASVLRAFKLSPNFLGDSGSSNRASSYTLRDLITQSVILPEGEEVANLCNDSFTHEFAIEKGYRKVNDDIVTEDNLLAELMFVPIQTMSQKDQAELQLAQLNSGAMTLDEFRAEVLGLPKIGTWIGKLSKTLIITAIQLSETSPTLVGSMLDDPELAEAIKADMKADVVEDIDDTVDDTVKALMYMRRGLNKVLTSKEVPKSTVKTMELFYDNLIEKSVEEDREAIKKLFKKD